MNLDVVVTRSKFSWWKILDPPHGKTTVYISPNYSAVGMLIVFVRIRYTLTAQ